jgi:competence protein ComEA
VRALLNEYGNEPTDDPTAPSSPSSWHALLARLPVRLDPGRSGAFAVGMAVLAAALITGLWLVTQRPDAVPVGAANGAQLSSAPTPVGSGALVTSAAATTSPASPTATLLVVDVAGKVRRPGLYRLPDGSRVDDAIRAAGGPLRGVDLSSLNLAALVADGQQILVGQPAAPGLVGGAPGATPAATGPVSLNTATLEQLETLPGVGPVLAQNIIDWRTANGGFDSVDQLTDVSGIGDVTFAELQPLVTL